MAAIQADKITHHTPMQTSCKLPASEVSSKVMQYSFGKLKNPNGGIPTGLKRSYKVLDNECVIFVKEKKAYVVLKKSPSRIFVRKSIDEAWSAASAALKQTASVGVVELPDVSTLLGIRSECNEESKREGTAHTQQTVAADCVGTDRLEGANITERSPPPTNEIHTLIPCTTTDPMETEEPEVATVTDPVLPTQELGCNHANDGFPSSIERTVSTLQTATDTVETEQLEVVVVTESDSATQAVQAGEDVVPRSPALSEDSERISPGGPAVSQDDELPSTEDRQSDVIPTETVIDESYALAKETEDVVDESLSPPTVTAAALVTPEPLRCEAVCHTSLAVPDEEDIVSLRHDARDEPALSLVPIKSDPDKKEECFGSANSKAPSEKAARGKGRARAKKDQMPVTLSELSFSSTDEARLLSTPLTLGKNHQVIALGHFDSARDRYPNGYQVTFTTKRQLTCKIVCQKFELYSNGNLLCSDASPYLALKKLSKILWARYSDYDEETPNEMLGFSDSRIIKLFEEMRAQDIDYEEGSANCPRVTEEHEANRTEPAIGSHVFDGLLDSIRLIVKKTSEAASMRPKPMESFPVQPWEGPWTAFLFGAGLSSAVPEDEALSDADGCYDYESEPELNLLPGKPSPPPADTIPNSELLHQKALENEEQAMLSATATRFESALNASAKRLNDLMCKAIALSEQQKGVLALLPETVRTSLKKKKIRDTIRLVVKRTYTQQEKVLIREANDLQGQIEVVKQALDERRKRRRLLAEELQLIVKKFEEDELDRAAKTVDKEALLQVVSIWRG